LKNELAANTVHARKSSEWRRNVYLVVVWEKNLVQRKQWGSWIQEKAFIFVCLILQLKTKGLFSYCITAKKNKTMDKITKYRVRKISSLL